MTGTCVLNNLDYKTFSKIRRAVQDANPTTLIYESYDRDISRGIFTFHEPAMIPDELKKYRIMLVTPQRPDFKNVDFPSLGDVALDVEFKKTKED